MLAVGFIRMEDQNKKILKYGMLGLLLISSGIILMKNALILRDSYGIYKDTSDKIYAEESNKIISSVSEEDKNDLIGYNVRPYFYLATGIKPCYKYFILQDWQSGKDKEMQEQQKNDFASGKAKYIVMEKKHHNRFDDIIDEN